MDNTIGSNALDEDGLDALEQRHIDSGLKKPDRAAAEKAAAEKAAAEKAAAEKAAADRTNLPPHLR